MVNIIIEQRILAQAGTAWSKQLFLTLAEYQIPVGGRKDRIKESYAD